ncbi:MAG: amino acid adenylation domain-containing protein, partial [bacterium]|nr:amino acid adenylation domain-containing protein [bacterium]
PDYMVPSAVVLLEALPWTPGGKVDRKALPAPEPSAMAVAADWVAPRNPIEEILAGIWSQVLDLGGVGVHDDFFAFGGHSLLATQVISRVRAELAVELPLRTLFEAPTVAGFAPHVFANLRREEGLEAPPIRPVVREGHPPLSFAQQRLWFLDRFEPDLALYTIPATLRFEGHLDRGALARALGEIVRRHEVLRTTYATVDGETVQMIQPRLVLALPVHDLTALRDADREAEVHRLASDDARRPFDIARGPVLRAALLRLGEDDHRLLLVIHHIAFDGWSAGIFLHELGVLYRAAVDGRPSPLPALRVQYADFAVWQRHWLAGPARVIQLAYWRERLRDLPVLELPTDRPRPAQQTFRGAAEGLALPAALGQDLRELARQHGTTVFMTLLAAFQLLLGRASRQRDFAVGSPVANRNRAEIEALVGFFVNTLVLRAELRGYGQPGEPTFAELAARVREVALGAYAHQDLPFEQLVEELRPQRDLSHSPLFQVMFVFQNASMAPPGLGPGLAVSREPVSAGTVKFDLTLSLEERDGTLRGGLGYNRDLFDRVTVRRLVGHLRTVLEAVAASPAGRISELDLLTAAERQQLTAEWNDTAVVRPRRATMHQLIEAQARRTPEAVAVVAGSRQLSFGELDRRANQLAHILRFLGVGRSDGASETLVGICAERSLEMVVGLVGILKAGGAYLPLDPSYPRERLAFMLEDSRVPVLLTQEHLAATLPAHGAKVVRLDADWPAIAVESRESPLGGGVAGNLAYAIYTSGSTGRPKGVMNTHRAIVNRILWMQEAYGLGPADRVLQKTPFSFDVSVWEFFWPLVTGARLVMARPEGHKDPAYLVEAIRRQGVTTLHFVPSMLQAFLEHPQVGSCGSLRRVIASGEALPFPLRQRFFARLGCGLHNLYGPTEAAVDVTFHACERAPARPLVPIGRPLANVAIHLLDPSLRPVPAGVPGELHIAGVNLARGYLSRPALTAEKFLPDPVGIVPGGRLYKTGDLARHLADGAIDYLGRLDYQVKLRGFRIELGEVEASLTAHPGVSETVAGIRGDQQLVAWIVAEGTPHLSPSGGTPPAVAELRSVLLETLPEYMVPARFVTLAALPLGPTGKVDRRALPAPEATVDENAAYAAPRTPAEELMAGLWGELLGYGAGRERIGVDDDFFELGGHSLLATQLVSRVRDRLGVELELRQVFRTPTVAGLAAAVDRGGQELAPPIEPLPSTVAPPLSFAQQRLWFLAQLEPEVAAYNMPMAVRLRGRLHRAALARALTEIVHRHQTLRTRFVARADGEPYQRIDEPAPFPLPLVDLAGLGPDDREPELERLACEDAARPFDLVRGPLLRAALLRCGERDHGFLLNLHHVISDGWSMGILRRELRVLYEAFATGAPVPLTELPIRYADFAHWQRQWLRGEVLAAQLAYWKQQLAGMREELELPTDRPRPAVPTYRGAFHRLTVPPELIDSLGTLSRREGSTLFMTLLAAFKLLLHGYTRQDDLAVGSPIANRNRSEIEGLIGFFVNTLVLRTKFGAGTTTFQELLAGVREQALGAYAHQDVPFEKLVEELQPERNLTRQPLFQVMFVL